MSGPSDLKPAAEGGDLQKTLATIAERSKEGKFLYTKFFAIGLFRLLELTGAKDPKALESLVSSMNIPQEAVSRDLMTYKVRNMPPHHTQVLAHVAKLLGMVS